MPVKYTCPECHAVLKPAQPVPAGKRIKCPKCGELFVPTAEEPAEAAPKPPTKPAKPAPRRPFDDEEDDGGDPTYTIADRPEPAGDAGKKETEALFEKPMRDRFPKSKRGPAQAAVIMPSNALMAAGVISCIGYLVLIAAEAWPMIFNEGKMPPNVGERWLYMGLYALTFAFGCLIIAGATQMQNLESYHWAVIGSMMAVLPTAFWFWPLTLPMGLWCLSVLRKPNVKAGFSFKKRPRPDAAD